MRGMNVNEIIFDSLVHNLRHRGNEVPHAINHDSHAILAHRTDFHITEIVVDVMSTTRVGLKGRRDRLRGRSSVPEAPPPAARRGRSRLRVRDRCLRSGCGHQVRESRRHGDGHTPVAAERSVGEQIRDACRRSRRPVLSAGYPSACPGVISAPRPVLASTATHLPDGSRATKSALNPVPLAVLAASPSFPCGRPFTGQAPTGLLCTRRATTPTTT